MQTITTTARAPHGANGPPAEPHAGEVTLRALPD